MAPLFSWLRRRAGEPGRRWSPQAQSNRCRQHHRPLPDAAFIPDRSQTAAQVGCGRQGEPVRYFHAMASRVRRWSAHRRPRTGSVGINGSIRSHIASAITHRTDTSDQPTSRSKRHPSHRPRGRLLTAWSYWPCASTARRKPPRPTPRTPNRTFAGLIANRTSAVTPHQKQRRTSVKTCPPPHLTKTGQNAHRPHPAVRSSR